MSCLAVIVACSKETGLEYTDPGNEFHLSAAPFVRDSADSSKSSLTDSGSVRISDCCILVYDSVGRYCRDISCYRNSPRVPQPDFSRYSGPFTLLLCANMGDVRASAPSELKDAASFSYTVENYESMNDKGFPMAGTVYGFVPGGVANLNLVRMVGRYLINIECNSTKAVYDLKAVVLRNASKKIWPFDTGGIMRPENPSSDIQKSAGSLGEADLLELKNSTGVVAVYFLENLQGIMLDNPERDPKRKCPANLTDPSRGELLSYIEITADVKTPTQKYLGNRYRFYLGDNAYDDFSVRRNVSYNVRLNFESNVISGSGDGADGNDWSTEPGELVDEAFISASCTRLNVLNGIDAQATFGLMSLNDREESITIAPATADDLRKINTQKLQWSYNQIHTDIAGRAYCSALFKVSTGRSIDGLAAYADDYYSQGEKIMFRVSSSDGRVNREFPVYVHHKAIPVYLRLDPGTRRLYAYSNVDCYELGVSLTCRGVMGKPFYLLEGNGDSRADFEFSLYPSSYGGVPGRSSWTNVNYSYRSGQAQAVNLDLSFSGTDVSVPYMGENTASYFQMRGSVLYNNPANWFSGMFHNVLIHEGQPPAPVSSCSRDVRITPYSMYAMGVVAGRSEPDGVDKTFFVYPFGGNNIRKTMGDYSLLNGCPFYFVNGGQIINRLAYDCTAKEGSLRCWGYMNGRDFLPDVQPDFQLYRAYTYFMLQIWQDVDHELISMDGHCYLTINGNSCWIGADDSERGFAL